MVEDKKLSPLEVLEKKHARDAAERAAKIEAATNDSVPPKRWCGRQNANLPTYSARK